MPCEAFLTKMLLPAWLLNVTIASDILIERNSNVDSVECFGTCLPWLGVGFYEAILPYKMLRNWVAAMALREHV